MTAIDIIKQRRLRAVCEHYGIPVVKFSNKNRLLKASDFELLLDRASKMEPA